MLPEASISEPWAGILQTSPILVLSPEQDPEGIRVGGDMTAGLV